MVINAFPRPKGRGFLQPEGDVPPRAIGSQQHWYPDHAEHRSRHTPTLSLANLRYL